MIIEHQQSQDLESNVNCVRYNPCIVTAAAVLSAAMQAETDNSLLIEWVLLSSHVILSDLLLH